MSTAYHSKSLFHVTAIDALNIDDAADTYEWVPVQPVDIRRVGFLATTAVANASGVVDVSIIKRPTAGSVTDQATVDTFVVTGTTTVPVGTAVVRELVIQTAQATALDGSLVNVGPAGPLHVGLGESVLFDMASAADSGAGMFFVEYYELPLTSTARLLYDVSGQVGYTGL